MHAPDPEAPPHREETRPGQGGILGVPHKSDESLWIEKRKKMKLT